MNYYFEYGGGLGDVFYQMYHDGTYSVLNNLGPSDRATIVLITHNPHAHELFASHPKANQIEVKDLGYWLPDQDKQMRKRHGLPPQNPSLQGSQKGLSFYPAPSDGPVLQLLRGKCYVAFSVSAGLPDRDIPRHFVIELLNLARYHDLLPVFVGRSYERWGRREFRPEERGVIDTIDMLTVPGVACVIQGAVGVVCCHSAINILAWLMRKAQLLLYPKVVYDQHISRRDQWAFGVDFLECKHAEFDDPCATRTAVEFFNELVMREHAIRKGGGKASKAMRKIRVIPLPPESQEIQLDESIARLTPFHEVKFLCWLAAKTKGNIVEIGCNKGLTTRDLARTNPHKIIYAVDYFAHDAPMAAEQLSERPSADEFCVYARGMRNVVCLHEKSAKLNYEALLNVKLIYIDGDHTFEAIKADSEAAIAFFRGHEGGTLVWHDYYEGGPAWVGVKTYVDSLELEIERVEGTWLALAKVEGKRGST